MFAKASNAVLIAALAGLLLSAQAVGGEGPSLDARPDCRYAAERTRRRPGKAAPEENSCDGQGLQPAVWRPLPELAAIPDRWRIVSALGYPERSWDPYNGNNVLKGDRPAFGEDWFVSLALISDTTFEGRSIPTPVASATPPSRGAIDLAGEPAQSAFTQNLITEFVLYKGDTVFRPPDWEFRFLSVFNLTSVKVEEAGVLKVDTTAATRRTEGFVGIQQLFVERHLRNVSERYDFDSLRIGIQPITADFRGFLFQDSPIGVRLFGTRDNNRWQYNIAWFRRIEKDTNSGLNDITENSFSDALRDDDVFLFNLYRQDFPFIGFTSQIALVHNRNGEDEAVFVDGNGFLVRPAAFGLQKKRSYDVTYVGYNGDGHIGRWNLTVSAYFAFGEESSSAFVAHKSDISAAFGAIEVSRDFDWIRLRATALYGSGDSDPYDDRSTGFDAISENPLIAGADTSFWIRQAIPLIGGGRVALSGQNGVLNSLRPNKFQGQSNFTNPGVVLLGVGADIEVSPQIRASLNVNQLFFADTAVLEAARNQAGLRRRIGADLSLAITYRPFTSQNIVLRLAGSMLVPQKGYKDLFGSEDIPYSIFANLILAY
ncbi:MAG: hypothetical protein V3S15_08425 [Woeseiaceae bacterium]